MSAENESFEADYGNIFGSHGERCDDCGGVMPNLEDGPYDASILCDCDWNNAESFSADGDEDLDIHSGSYHGRKKSKYDGVSYISPQLDKTDQLKCKCGFRKEFHYPFSCYSCGPEAHSGKGKIVGFTTNGRIIWRDLCTGKYMVDTDGKTDIDFFNSIHQCKEAESFSADESNAYQVITTDWKSSMEPKDRYNNDKWFITGDISFATPDSSGNYGRGVETISLISTFGEGLTKETAKEDAINRATSYLYPDVSVRLDAEYYGADNQIRDYRNIGIGAALVAGIVYWFKR